SQLITCDDCMADELVAAPRSTRGERWAIVAISLAMVSLPVAEMLARKLLGRGVPGGTVYTQHCTLWLGFLGAIVATANGRHLGLATGHLLPSLLLRRIAGHLGTVVAATACLCFAWASYATVMAEREGNNTLAGGLPEWWSEIIVPIALLCIA